MRLSIHGSTFPHCGNRRPSAPAVGQTWQAAYRGLRRLCYDAWLEIVPQKRLWRLTDADGADVACELEALSSNRVLLVVKRNGDPIVTETFADKRDALARSVGIYKEMKDR